MTLDIDGWFEAAVNWTLPKVITAGDWIVALPDEHPLVVTVLIGALAVTLIYDNFIRS